MKDLFTKSTTTALGENGRPRKRMMTSRRRSERSFQRRNVGRDVRSIEGFICCTKWPLHVGPDRILWGGSHATVSPTRQAAYNAIRRTRHYIRQKGYDNS